MIALPWPRALNLRRMDRNGFTEDANIDETQMTRQEEKDNGLTGGTHDKHKGPDY